MSHTLQATCGTLPCNEDEQPTINENGHPYSHLASKVRYFHVTPNS